jgi:signal transduction histidine kinase
MGLWGADLHASERRARLSSLFRPARGISDLAERRSAQLVAAVTVALFVLTALALVGMLVVDMQLFWSRAPVMATLLLTHALIYGLNRTRFYRLAALLLCVAPIWSDLAVGLSTPEDPVWYALMPASTVLASILLSFRAAVMVGALGIVSTGTVVGSNLQLLGEERGMLITGYVVIFTAILLATARFRAWVERGRRAELQELERKLAATQRMEAVGRLASSVAHDFNNFLTVIQGNVQLARLRQPAAEELADIAMAAERASALTDQLLAFARQRPTSPVTLHLDALIARLTPILERLVGERVKLAITLASRWAVDADPVQLEQILLNLAANARDAMPAGGRLELGTSHDTLTVRTSMGALPGDYVVLTVKDEGEGMDSVTLDRAFEPFFTTKLEGKGSGLGLATVRGIVMQSGGDIEVHSQPGRGTTFRVLLPRSKRESTSPARALPAASEPTSMARPSL